VPALDHALHPEIAEDERLQQKRRAEQGDEPLAVDIEGQRLLADDVALDLVDTTSPDLQICPHRLASRRRPWSLYGPPNEGVNGRSGIHPSIGLPRARRAPNMSPSSPPSPTGRTMSPGRAREPGPARGQAPSGLRESGRAPRGVAPSIRADASLVRPPPG